MIDTDHLNRWARIGAKLEPSSRARLARHARGAISTGEAGRAATKARAAAISGDMAAATYIAGAARTLGYSRRAAR
jgi:hypothetical protein